MSNQKGFIGDVLLLAGILLMVPLTVFLLFFVRFKTSDEVVSGIVYNTSNNSLIGGNTHFSVRASEATYTTEENQSTYCVPGDSKYKELVNRAAESKDVKVVVKASKYFAFKMPWTCVNNVTVEEVK